MGNDHQRTLVLMKPDAVQRGLIGRIISRFEQVGLNIVACRMLHIDDELAAKHYAVHKDKPFYKKLTGFITSGPVMALAIEGNGAIDLVRKLIGPTDGATAPPGTIRGDFGRDLTLNLVHASDSPETAEYELALFFSDDDYTPWGFDIKHWMRHPEN
jgi:nucleoside-diphosphate kinase